MSEAKISIRAAGFEVEYSGDRAFLEGGLFELIKNIAELKTFSDAIKQSEKKDPTSHNSAQNPSQGGNHSTNTIATLLGSVSGSDLTIAAAAHLTLSKGKDTFTRSELTTEMKSAAGFFNKSYISNLSKSLNTLTSQDRLRLVAKDTYALSNKEKTEIEAKLAKQD